MNVFVPLLAGLAHALSLAWPFGFWFAAGAALPWLQCAALVVLVACLRPGQSPRTAALLGWCFGVAMLSGTFWWLFISMHTYGGLAAPLAALAVLALAAALALPYAAATAVYVAWRGASPWWRAPVFAAAWTLAELLRGNVATGFPWGVGGYAHVDGWLAGLAPWVGVYGLAALAAACAAWLGEVPRAPWRSAWVMVATAAALAGLAEWLRPPPDAPDICTADNGLRVALLQGDIPQDQKFVPGTGVADALKWYGEQLLWAQAALVVAPETAIPVLPSEMPAALAQSLAARFAGPLGTDRAALVGLPLGDSEVGYTNSVWGLKPGQAENYRYDKHHLVPFGEFVPSGFKWFTRLMNIPLGDFNRGSLTQPSFAWQRERLAPNICYEDLFGEELGARFAEPSSAPTVFVNVSNLGWFGDSVAIDQHLAIARMRSLEFARPTLRATNTGATVIIDQYGRVTHRLARLTRGVLYGHVRGNEDLTPYARWVSAWGLWPLWALAVAVLVAARARAVSRAKRPLP